MEEFAVDKGMNRKEGGYSIFKSFRGKGIKARCRTKRGNNGINDITGLKEESGGMLGNDCK